MNLYFAIPLLPGGNMEWFIVVMAALMIFGSRLPEVALRAVAHVMRIRRAIAKMWQETGLEDELRRVRRDIELSIPREADFKVKEADRVKKANDARAAAERAREASERNARNQVEAAAATHADSLSVDPDAHRSGEVTLAPAEGIVGNGDWTPDEDPIRRDQIPGADRQEPTTYYEEEPYDDDAPGPDPASDPASDPAPEPENGPSVDGDHFGAGIQPPPPGGA